MRRWGGTPARPWTARALAAGPPESTLMRSISAGSIKRRRCPQPYDFSPDFIIPPPGSIAGNGLFGSVKRPLVSG
jgi:hypothetical protein